MKPAKKKIKIIMVTTQKEKYLQNFENVVEG
jgi:hypothetical protein